MDLKASGLKASGSKASGLKAFGRGAYGLGLAEQILDVRLSFSSVVTGRLVFYDQFYGINDSLDKEVLIQLFPYH